MRKIALSAAAVIAALVVLLLAALVALETRWFSDYLSGKLSDSLGREVDWAGPLQIDWSLSPRIVVEQPRVENATWAENDSIASAERISARIDLTQVFDGFLVVEQVEVTEPDVNLAQSPTQGNNWSFLTPEEPPEEPPLLEPRVGTVMISDGSISFVAPEHDTSIAVTIDAPDGEQLAVDGSGQVLGRPIMLSLIGGPPGKAATEVMTDENVMDSYSVAGQVRWQGHLVRVDGQTQSFTELGEFQLEMSAEGPDANALAQPFGYSTNEAPYFLSGRFQHQDEQWSLTDVSGSLGESELDGRMALDMSGDRPQLLVDMEVNALNVDETLPFLMSEQEEDKPEDQQPWRQTVQNQLSLLNEFDADVSLYLGRLIIGDTTLREINAVAQLESGLLQIDPVSLAAEQGHVVLNGRLNAEGSSPSGTASVALQNLDLGQILSGFGYAELGSLDGRLSVRLQDQLMTATDSKLHYWEQENETAVTLELENEQTDTGGPAIAATLSGQVRNQPVSGNYFSGPLVSLVVREDPVPVRMDLQLADTEFSADGTVTQPLQLVAADLDISAAGPGTSTFNELAPFEIPQMPSYDIDGKFVREEEFWYLRELDATVGSSDISGDIRWQIPADERPTVWATLHSDVLRSEDFLPENESQNTGDSPEDDTAPEDDAEEPQGDEDVLPEGRVFREYLQALNAEVEYTAQKLDLAGVAFDETHIDLSLSNGVLRLQPLSLGVASGEIELQFELDAESMPAQGNTEIELAQVSLKDLLENFDVVDETFGTVGGRGQFSFTGDSLADALAALEGELRLMMDGGQINALVVEALGLDAGELLLGLIGDEPDPVDIQCAYTELDAEGGIIDIAHFTIATEDSNIHGNGSVDMGQEEFELVIEADPKDFSLLSGSSPIELSGTFKNLNIDVVSRELVGKGALTAVAAVAFPPAALAPLVETGATSGTGGCNDLVASME